MDADSLRQSLPYRPCVGIFLLNREGKVLVARRIDREEAWQMPQGGIDDGEDAAVAAMRELAEEIGTSRAEIVGETEGWIHYDLPDELLGKVLTGYRGQTQKWFAMRFAGRDEDIDLETEVPEFDDWRWVGVEELVELAVPFKRAVYEQVVAAFRHLTT